MLSVLLKLVPPGPCIRDPILAMRRGVYSYLIRVQACSRTVDLRSGCIWHNYRRGGRPSRASARASSFCLWS